MQDSQTKCSGVIASIDLPHDAFTRDEVFQNESFPFGIRQANPQAPNKLHTHEGFWELTIVYKGEGIHFTEDEEYLVRAGDVFVIKGNQKHGYKDARNLHLTNICFDPNSILVQISHVKKLPGYHVLFCLEPKYRHSHKFESRLRLSPEETFHMMSLVGMMETELNLQLPGYEYTVTALFMQSISYLCRRYAQTTLKTSRNLMQMANVISYLEMNYAEQIDLKNLEDIAHMSPSTLLRKFKEATGYTPIDYLIRVRISRAVDLLRNQDMSITSVAFAVGFLDGNYFTRQFKHVMNISPSEYRALMQPLTSNHPNEKTR